MSDVAVRGYDGAPSYVKGAPSAPKRDAVKITHRQTVKVFQELADRALNAADFERTMHLPVGKGRLACDPDTGDFDADATRPHYNPSSQPFYPRHIHSTVTAGEHAVVNSKAEHEDALDSGKWSDKPLEKRRRFTLTADDEVQNLKAEVLATRAQNLHMENRLQEIMSGASDDKKEQNSILAKQLQQEREARVALEERMNQILAQVERMQSQPAQTQPPQSEETVVVDTAAEKKKK